ncbi:MAG TPA: flavin reductase family protein [Candidatus Nanoarchaeia archaeon]|nr:flavin reductase family protein [Candidatus Nanoarchaeia archaeon]
MNIPWGSDPAKKFVTNVGLITSTGPYGDNIMSAEWTHQVSYEPGLIAICLKSSEATHANIEEEKEFGINLSAQDQNVLVSVAGGSSGKNVNKIELLRELGFKFSRAKKIKVLMVDGAALNVECRLVNTIELGDHTLFVGEAVEVHPITAKEPIVYHGQKFWKLGDNIPRTSEQEMNKIKSLIEKHTKK